MRSSRLPILAAVALAGAAVLIAAVALSGEAEKTQGLIVFSSNRSGPWHLWTVRPDGSDLKELTDRPRRPSDVDPCWSPDGKSILFCLDARRQRPASGAWPPTAPSPSGSATATRPSGRRTASASPSAAMSNSSSATWPAATRNASPPPTGRTAPAPPGAPTARPSPLPAAGTPATPCSWCRPTAARRTKLFDKEGACEPHWSPDGRTIVYETETHIARHRRRRQEQPPRHVVRRGSTIRAVQPRRQVDRLLPGRDRARPVGTVHRPRRRRQGAAADRRRQRYESGLEAMTNSEGRVPNE